MCKCIGYVWFCFFDEVGLFCLVVWDGGIWCGVYVGLVVVWYYVMFVCFVCLWCYVGVVYIDVVEFEDCLGV